MKRVTLPQLARWQAEVANEPEPPERPRTRADCLNGPRPCPWVSCRHHLYLDVNRKGNLLFNFPDVEPEEMEKLPSTCALDVADEGAATLERTGELMNLTRERVRQVEHRVMHRVERTAPEALRETAREGGGMIGLSHIARAIEEQGSPSSTGGVDDSDEETTSTNAQARHLDFDVGQAECDRVWATYERLGRYGGPMRLPPPLAPIEEPEAQDEPFPAPPEPLPLLTETRVTAAEPRPIPKPARPAPTSPVVPLVLRRRPLAPSPQEGLLEALRAGLRRGFGV